MNKYLVLSLCLISLLGAARDPFSIETAAPSKNLTIRSYILNYASAETLASMLQKNYAGIEISSEPERNTLLITAEPQQHKDIQRTLQNIDTPLPQVCIEVQAIELSNNDLSENGID